MIVDPFSAHIMAGNLIEKEIVSLFRPWMPQKKYRLHGVFTNIKQKFHLVLSG